MNGFVFAKLPFCVAGRPKLCRATPTSRLREWVRSAKPPCAAAGARGLITNAPRASADATMARGETEETGQSGPANYRRLNITGTYQISRGLPRRCASCRSTRSTSLRHAHDADHGGGRVRPAERVGTPALIPRLRRSSAVRYARRAPGAGCDILSKGRWWNISADRPQASVATIQPQSRQFRCEKWLCDGFVLRIVTDDKLVTANLT